MKTDRRLILAVAGVGLALLVWLGLIAAMVWSTLEGSERATLGNMLGPRLVLVAMVLAVNWPPQAPAPGQALFSTWQSFSLDSLPAPCAPTASNTSCTVIERPSRRPWAMLPPYRATPGMFRRASAMAAAGMVLSQPHSTTIASRQWPSTASSIESVMISRLTSEARMPEVPMAMPSVTAMVLNSIGVPPAARMPSQAAAARSRRFRLHGLTLDQVCTTAISGLAMASSSSPVARSMARAGARSGPCLIALLRM